MGGVDSPSASPISRTAASALSGSCHQCGSPCALRRHRRSPSRRPSALPPARETIFAIQPSRPSPFSNTTFAPRASASTSSGRGSYSCGSVFGWRIWCTVTASPPTARAQSPICVVVATTSTPRARPPASRSRRAGAPPRPRAAASRSHARAPQARTRRRRARRSRLPGGRSPRPRATARRLPRAPRAAPTRAATCAGCASTAASSPRARRRARSSSIAPTAASADVTASAIASRSSASAGPRAYAERSRGSRVEPDREPAPGEHDRDEDDERAGRAGEREVRVADGEHAAEEQRLDVRPRVEDVAREDRRRARACRRGRAPCRLS